MKKIFYLFIIVFNVCFSQLKVSEDKTEFIGKVQFIECTKINDQINFTYNDHKFTQIDVYKNFQLTENDFNELYKIIINNFETAPSDPIKIETPKDILYLNYTKNLGVVSLQISHAVDKNPELIGITRFLTKKQIIKLFGKTKD